MKGPIRSFLTDLRASAAAEFTFIMPVLLIFIGGIFECGRWYQAYNEVNRLATRYAQVYADCNDNPNNVSPSPQNCSSEMGQYWSKAAIANIAPQLTAANVTVRMFQLQYSSGGVATIVYRYPANATLSAAESSAGATVIYTSGAQETGVVVTVQYPYVALVFPQLFQRMTSGANLNLSYTVAQRNS